MQESVVAEKIQLTLAALLGATHEFQEEAYDSEIVEQELKELSYPFASNIWDAGVVERITCGVRVQSNRGKNGRLPIIGKYDTELHHNAWLFTGLSSRGLLYHGVFGDILTDMILERKESEAYQQRVDIDWWKKS
jgi:hypothetical protein